MSDHVANELESIAYNIESNFKNRSYRDFLKLALIHTIKIVGRRDFAKKGPRTAPLFDDLSSRSSVPIFQNKVKRMLIEMETLVLAILSEFGKGPHFANLIKP